MVECRTDIWIQAKIRLSEIFGNNLKIEFELQIFELKSIM